MARRWPSGDPTSRPSPSPAPRPEARRRGTTANRSAATRAGARSASFEVVVHRFGSETERDPLLALEPVADQLLGLVWLVGVIAAGHRGDVGLGGRLIGDRQGRDR